MTDTPKLSARERREQAVEKQARAALTDRKYDWLRSRAARIALVAAMTVIIVGTPFAWILGGIPVGILVVILSFVAWGALRVSVRVVADLPDEVLDERQVAVRNAVYLQAYRWFVGIVVLAASAGLVWLVIAGDAFSAVTFTLTWETGMAIFWVLEMCALALPSMVFALRERGE